MTARVRLPASVDLQGVARATKPIPVTRTRFMVADVKNPETLSRLLTEHEKATHDATLYARAAPDAAALYFTVTMGTGGTKTLVRHSLGRPVCWEVVGWSSQNGGWNLADDQLDATPQTDLNVLAIKSTVAGTAILKIYGKP